MTRLVLLAALAVGCHREAPRWEMICDGKPCGSAPESTETFRLPSTDGYHRFEMSLRRANDDVVRYELAYSTSGIGKGPATANMDSYSTTHLRGTPELGRVALQVTLAGARLLRGSSVPNGGFDVPLDGRAWTCRENGCFAKLALPEEDAGEP